MTIRIAEGQAIRENVCENGLLAASAADLYECPVMTQMAVHTLICHNTHAANSNTVKLYVQPSGGTARQFLEVALAAGERVEGRGEAMPLNAGDKLRGEATNADEVAWFMLGIEETVV